MNEAATHRPHDVDGPRAQPRAAMGRGGAGHRRRNSPSTESWATEEGGGDEGGERRRRRPAVESQERFMSHGLPQSPEGWSRAAGRRRRRGARGLDGRTTGPMTAP